MEKLGNGSVNEWAAQKNKNYQKNQTSGLTSFFSRPSPSILAVAIILPTVFSFLLAAPDAGATAYTFTQNAWSTETTTGVNAQTTPTGWSQYATKDVDIDNSVSSSLKLKTAQTADVDTTFAEGYADQVSVNTSDQTLGALLQVDSPPRQQSIYNTNSKNNSLVVDNSGNIYAFYYTTDGSGNNKLALQVSKNNAVTWQAPINIPASFSYPSGTSRVPTTYGDSFEAGADSTYIYVAFNAYRTSSPRFAAVLISRCTISTDCSIVSNWSAQASVIAQAIDYEGDGAFNGTTYIEKAKDISLKIVGSSLHSTFLWSSDGAYASCSSINCSLGGNWSMTDLNVPNNAMTAIDLAVNSSNHVFINFQVANNGKSVLNYGFCKSNCTSYSSWYPQNLPLNSTSLGIINTDTTGATSTDTIIDANGYVVMVYYFTGASKAVYYHRSRIALASATSSTTTASWFDQIITCAGGGAPTCELIKNGSYGYQNSVSVGLTSGNAIRVVFNDSALGLFTAIKTQDPTALGWKCSNTSTWYCYIEVEGTVKASWGVDLTFKNGSPIIMAGDNAGVYIISKRFYSTGNFYSKVYGGTSANWRSVVVNMLQQDGQPTPSGTNLQLYVRSSDTDSTQHKTTSGWCTTNFSITALTNTLDLSTVSACAYFSTSAKYFQYYLHFTTDSTQQKTPLVSGVTLNYLIAAKTANLTSSTIQLDTTAGNLPVISSVSWTETMPYASSATTKLQIRSAPSASFSAPNDLWYGSGSTSGGFFYDQTDPSSSSQSAKDPACTRTPVSSTATTVTRTVTCQIDPSSPLYKNGYIYTQYKLILESNNQDGSPVVSQVQVRFTINVQPSVSNVAISQNSAGLATINYNLTDDNNSLSIGLFYDLGITLDIDPTASSSTITVTPPSGLDLSALLPSSGIILIDDEQILYQYRGSTYLGSSSFPVTRGYANTIPASHSVATPKKVWVRAVDSSFAGTLGLTSYASGAIGSGQTTGSGKSISWLPARDIIGKIYMTGLNIRVVANDGQLVKPTGGATIASNFTLDTKAPQIGSNALAFSTNVVDNGGKPKAKNTSIGLTITTPNTANDNSSGNRMSFCAGTCGVPDATELLAVGGAWSDLEVFGTTKTLTIGNNQAAAQTVNVAVMDNVGNISVSKKDIVYDVAPPQKPSNFSVEDASNQAIGALVYLRWQAIAIPTDGWGTSDFSKFSIYRKEASDCSSTSGTFAEITSLGTVSTTSYVDSSAQPTVNYIYKIVAVDNINNSSSDLTTAPTGCVKPQPSGEPAPPPPVITNIAQGSATTNSIVVTWKTTEPSDSRIAYTPRTRPVGGDFTGYQTQGNSGIVTDHTVTLVGLEPGTLYYFEVRSLPPGATTAGVRSIYDSSDVGFTPDLPLSFTTATPPPVIKPVITLNSPVVTFTHDTATFKWTTDIDADSFIEYGTSASLGNYFGQKESTKIHDVTITSLTPSAVYYYRIHSTAGDGESISPIISQPPASFTTTQDPKDTTPPTYQNIQVNNIQFNTATITWTTNEPATQFVEFWKDGDTSDQHRLYPITKGELLTAHSVQLPLDLQPETVYHYQVISFDASNNGIPSPQQPSFTTKADPGNVPDPIITNLRNDPATSTTVTIYFSTTNIPSSAIIEYSADDEAYNLAQSFPIITNDHALTLLNLTPAKLYFFRAKAINTVGQAVTQNLCAGQTCSFTTLASDNPLPTIVEGSIQVTNISPNNATITWQTTQPGNSLVEFGTAVSDSGEPLYGRTFGNVKDNTTSHTIILPDDLIPEQTYHFRVRTRDAFNQLMVYPAAPDPTDPACLTNAANCQDPTFTTTVSQQILVAESKTPPIITGVAPLLVTDTKAVVGWTTDKPADSEVNFGISTSYGSTLSDKLPPAGTNANALTRSHAMTIDGLQPKTKYYFKVISTDISDQRQEEDNGGAGYSFETTAGTGLGESENEGLTDDLLENDIIAPIISNVTISDITDNGATLNWLTNESATSLAEYGEDAAYGSLSGDVSTLTSQHTVKIEGLLSGTEYHVRAVSYDGFGNGARSNDFTFTTAGEKTEEDEDDKDKDGEDEKGQDELDEATKKIKELSAEKKLSLEKIIELLQEYAEEDVAKILNSIGVQLVSPPKFTGGAPRVEVTTTSATITWQTDKESDSRVAWVKGDDYRASKDDPYTSETGDTQNFTANHEVDILNLEPGTVYHYQLRSREAAGRTARSIDRTFKTLPLKPEIQGLRISGVTENTATLTWKTNVATKSVINYVDASGKEKRSQGDPQFVTNHTFTINDLAGNTAYTVTLIAEDENGLKVEAKPLGLRTIKDNSAPVISQVRTEVSLTSGKQDVAQAIITWKTNESSNSQILYEEGVTPGADPKLASDKGSEYLQNHVIVINRLRPATVYRFRVVSEDRAGNKAVSNDFTLLTPQKKESVLEIIVKNFEETFGFLKLFGR